MSNIKMTVKQVKAFTKVCDKKSTRYYETVVNVQADGTLTAGSPYYLLRMKAVAVNIDDNILEERACGVHIAAVETAGKVAVARGEPIVELGLTETNMVAGSFPPVAAAFPSDPVSVGSYDIDFLITMLQALKAASTERTTIVTLSTNRAGGAVRPMLLELSGQADVCGLVVPSRL